MKELNTGKSTILEVEVPTNLTKLRVLPTINELELISGDVIFGKEYRYYKLPFNCEIIGIASEITEEQAKELVPLIKRVYGQSYYDYTVKFKVGYGYVGTSIQSWHSFMTAHQINPNSLILKKI